MNIVLYSCNTERNRVDKTPFLSEKGVISGTLRDETSIASVILTIEYEHFVDFNYIYIEEFNRYYFVEDIIVVNNNLYEIHTKVDVLMSYKDELLELYGFIDRNEFLSNPDIIDKNAVIEQGYNVENIEVENRVFLDAFDKSNVNYKTNTIGLNYPVIVINGYKISTREG